MRGNSNVAVLVFIGAPVYINIRYGALAVVYDAMRILCNFFLDDDVWLLWWLLGVVVRLMFNLFVKICG